MRCTSPRTVGFYADGKTLCWSKRKYSKEYPTFQLPCSKCIACRLEYARQWAIRCVHESLMHPENSFITLTYSDENLTSDKLKYEDFQLFMKRLRKSTNNELGMFVTGEYGDQRKRPHWHAIIFNWQPKDLTYKYSNDRGDKVYSSATLEKLWPHGISEVGSVTFESAGYCARYAAKKLSHGRDETHDFHPISKKSSKNAIGKKYLEKFYQDVFSLGFCLIQKSNGEIVKSGIPRYYEKWLKKHHPNIWRSYVTQLKNDFIQHATKKSEEEQKQELIINEQRYDSMGLDFVPQTTSYEAKSEILKHKFQKLQEHKKL